MGRRSRDMRDAASAERGRESSRSPRRRRTVCNEPWPDRARKKYLQAAVSANVVESRPLLQGLRADRADQRAQRMNRELRRPAGAGGRQNPFGFDRRLFAGRAMVEAAGEPAARTSTPSAGVAAASSKASASASACAAARLELCRRPIRAGTAICGAPGRRDQSRRRRPWPCRRHRARRSGRRTSRARRRTASRRRKVVERDGVIARRDGAPGATRARDQSSKASAHQAATCS